MWQSMHQLKAGRLAPATKAAAAHPDSLQHCMWFPCRDAGVPVTPRDGSTQGAIMAQQHCQQMANTVHTVYRGNAAATAHMTWNYTTVQAPWMRIQEHYERNTC